VPGSAQVVHRPTAQVVVTLIGAFAVLALDAVSPVGLAIWLLQVVLVWIASLWASGRQMVVIGSVCSVFIVLGYWLSPDDGTVFWLGSTNIVLGLATVWVIVQATVRQRATERARREAAEQLARSQATIRILSGLLPICSVCKKIQSEGGAWEQLELYIRDHSEADFTHGICKECFERLYPGFSYRS
jgi:hypothetical protein